MQNDWHKPVKRHSFCCRPASKEKWWGMATQSQSFCRTRGNNRRWSVVSRRMVRPPEDTYWSAIMYESKKKRLWQRQVLRKLNSGTKMMLNVGQSPEMWRNCRCFESIVQRHPLSWLIMIVDVCIWCLDDRHAPAPDSFQGRIGCRTSQRNQSTNTSTSTTDPRNTINAFVSIPPLFRNHKPLLQHSQPKTRLRTVLASCS